MFPSQNFPCDLSHVIGFELLQTHARIAYLCMTNTELLSFIVFYFIWLF